jgi:hypothetical protein
VKSVCAKQIVFTSRLAVGVSRARPDSVLAKLLAPLGYIGNGAQKDHQVDNDVHYDENPFLTFETLTK